MLFTRELKFFSQTLWNTDIEKLIGLDNGQNVRLQRQHRLTIDATTDQWRHSQIRILSSLVTGIILVRKHRQQTVTFWWHH